MTQKYSKSREVPWNTTPEVFQFFSNRWNVTKAKELILSKRSRAVGSMGISGVAALVGKPPVEGQVTLRTVGITVDWEKAASDEVDLDIPVILAPHRDSYIPIDGWHRIAKAVLKGITELPCVVLNKTEANQIKC